MGVDRQDVDQPGFLDDFTDPNFARYYEVQPGVGEIARRPRGLHYTITRGPDGPPSAADYLTIDSLGRPQPPTAKVVLRFLGTRWITSIKVDYDFETKANGRHACLWLVFGEPSERYEGSLVFVRSADLDPASHQLSFQLHRPPKESVSKILTNHPRTSNWLRIERADCQLNVEWSEDGKDFAEIMEWRHPAAPATQSIVINSASFAGGASFVLRSIAIEGSHPIQFQSKPPLFSVAGSQSALASVPAEDVIGALNAGRSVSLERCAILGAIDLARIASPLASDLSAQKCDFTGRVYASRPITVTGVVSIVGSKFRAIGLSSVRFTRPFQTVGCQFLSDTRFIETAFDGGADLSGCTFVEKPFFRIMRADRALSLYYCDFPKGADFSGSRVSGDLSISDIGVAMGTLTFHRAIVDGTTRLMVTLQRDPQLFGGALDFSNSRMGSLVVSSGDRDNRSEYTGPPRWDLAADVFLNEAEVRTLVLHNVQFLKAIVLTDAKIGSVLKKTAQFSQVVGEWPVDTEFYSCFISYSSKDQAFTEHLHARLRANGVQCWYAPKDLKIGDPFRQKIDDAIHEHDRLLLVLSEESVKSDWVREEVEACFERERREKRPVLFPIRLDDAIMNTQEAWAASIRRQRHMGDFRGWREPDKYRESFDRLLRDLKAGGNAVPSIEGGGGPSP